MSIGGCVAVITSSQGCVGGMWEATSALILGLWESLFYVWKSNSPALSVLQDKTAKKKKAWSKATHAVLQLYSESVYICVCALRTDCFCNLCPLLQKSAHRLKAISHIQFIQNDHKSEIVRNLCKQRRRTFWPCKCHYKNSMTADCLLVSYETHCEWVISEGQTVTLHKLTDHPRLRSPSVTISSSSVCFPQNIIHLTLPPVFVLIFSLLFIQSIPAAIVLLYSPSFSPPCSTLSENHPPVPLIVMTEIFFWMHSVETS